MTELLLDTHIVLWWLHDDPRLTAVLRTEITVATAVHVSAASTWEVAIKRSVGKLDLELEAHESFPTICAAQGFELVALTHEDAWAVERLPSARTDPFDRLIAATARRRGWTVVTTDDAFELLDVPLLRPG